MNYYCTITFSNVLVNQLASFVVSFIYFENVVLKSNNSSLNQNGYLILDECVSVSYALALICAFAQRNT